MKIRDNMKLASKATFYLPKCVELITHKRIAILENLHTKLCMNKHASLQNTALCYLAIKAKMSANECPQNQCDFFHFD